jgi:hypothetical protein
MVMKSIKLSALALAATAFFAVFPLSEAEAQYHRRHAGDALVGGVIGGAIGGLTAGAIISANRPVYHPPVYAPAPVYHAPVAVEPTYVEDVGPVYRKRPVYWARPAIQRAPDLEVVPSCYMQRQRIWLDRYTYTNRYTRICD